MKKRAVVAFSAVAVLLLSGCASSSTTGVFTILDDGAGPVLCDVVRESYPPSCDGTPVLEWDWEQWPHSDVNGVRWGEYSLKATPEQDHVRVEFIAELND